MDFPVPRKKFAPIASLRYETKTILGQLFLPHLFTLQSTAMRVMLLFLFGSLLGSLGQEDLQRKAFIFLRTSNTDHVILNATRQQPLTSFTVCLRSYSDLTRDQGLFSYATRKHSNAILLFKPSSNTYHIWVGSEYVAFSVPGTQGLNLGWEHICTSWESTTGLLTFWLNGKPFPRKSLMRGWSISPEASILLGQDQDFFGGGFESQQSFVGEMEDVYMFDRVLSPAEVHLLRFSYVLPNTNYLIDWRSLSFNIQGNVTVEPSLFYRNGDRESLPRK